MSAAGRACASHVVRRALPACVLLLGAACSGGGGAPTAAPGPPTPFAVFLPASTVALGGTVARAGTVTDAAGSAVGYSLTWSSDNAAVAAVSAAGVVTGVGAGSTTVRVSAPNGATGTMAVTVADLTFTALSVGARSACASTAGGTLYCWGNNGPGTIGALGDDQVCYVDLFCSTTPRVGVASPTFAQVTMGGNAQTCGLTAAGVAYCWGRNDTNGLGAVSTETCQVKTAPLACSHTPLLVEGGHTFTALSVGSHAGTTCGLTAAGAAWCWPAPGGSRTPAAVPGGLVFAALTSGSVHACGLTAAGAAYCWGSNSLGPMGTGAPDSPTPAAVTGGLVFTMLSAAMYHTCGLTATGAAYCWGANATGQLGDGTVTTRATPTAVLGGLSFATISSGSGHTCGVTTAGAAWCWGMNLDAGAILAGMLGDGTSTQRLAPVAVVGGHIFADVQAASSGTCGRTTAGRIYCWGGNRFGLLGIGTHGDAGFVTSPVGLGGAP